MTAVLICAIVAIVLILVIMAVIIYNQMLLVNQVNKRLLVMAKESIEKERSTMQDLQQALEEFENETGTQTLTNPAVKDALEEDEPFDPHTFDTSNLE